jgi:hypothetical protein
MAWGHRGVALLLLTAVAQTGEVSRSEQRTAPRSWMLVCSASLSHHGYVDSAAGNRSWVR